MGHFQARVDGCVRPLPHSVERVLALVALVGPLARSRAGAMLWPNAAPSRAGANLRSALSRLGDLTHDFIHMSGEVLALAEEASLDFAHALAWANGTIYDPAGPVAVAPPSWIGRTLLPGWEEDWLEGPNERLRMLEAEALEAAGERLLTGGHLDQALPYALAAVDVQPWSESANRLVVEIHARRGDATNALRHYRRFRSVLLQELGVEPGPDMRASIRQLYPFGNLLVDLDGHPTATPPG